MGPLIIQRFLRNEWNDSIWNEDVLHDHCMIISIIKDLDINIALKQRQSFVYAPYGGVYAM